MSIEQPELAEHIEQCIQVVREQLVKMTHFKDDPMLYVHLPGILRALEELVALKKNGRIP